VGTGAWGQKKKRPERASRLAGGRGWGKNPIQDTGRCAPKKKQQGKNQKVGPRGTPGSYEKGPDYCSHQLSSLRLGEKTRFENPGKGRDRGKTGSGGPTIWGRSRMIWEICWERRGVRLVGTFLRKSPKPTPKEDGAGGVHCTRGSQRPTGELQKNRREHRGTFTQDESLYGGKKRHQQKTRAAVHAGTRRHKPKKSN